MKVFEIIPRQSVGPIRIGMTRPDVEAVFGKPEYVHDGRIGYLSGFMVDYDTSGKVEFIELSHSELFEATLDGRNLHKVRAEMAIEIVSKYGSYDQNDPELGYSYIFKAVQISLWRGTLPESDEDVDGQYFEAVGIAAENYFA